MGPPSPSASTWAIATPHVHALGAGGEVLRERRVRTTAAALGAALTGLPPARVVLEAGRARRG